MFRVSLLGLTIAGALAWSIVGAQPPAPPQQQPVFRTEANYVRVDVFPTKDGQSVADLTADDFEVFEDRALQKIDAFEHVRIRGSLPQNQRREPNTVGESLAAANGVRDRMFVLFLDFNHVDVDGSRQMRQPLVAALDKLIGPDDLVAVMTPDMRARDLTFARRTTTIDGILQRHWTWGERDRLNPVDPIDESYKTCYPGAGPLVIPPPPPPPGTRRPPSEMVCRSDDRGIADEMIERRREKQTLDALRDLVEFLGTASDARKAILTITEGWRLFEPDASLSRELYCEPPRTSDLGIDPKTGRLTSKGTDPGQQPEGYADCERDRLVLANIDDELEFREILDRANRANVSFYPVDPRGLTVFDSSLEAPIQGMPKVGVNRPTPMQDAARVTARVDSLRIMAEDTDGIAIVNSTDLAAGLQRIVDDLSSYYLIGYYSTGKLDGKFHSISVRVKRPGVDVRARKGYLAATLAEVSNSARGGTPPSTVEALESSAAAAFDAALAPLGAYTRDVPLRIMAVSGWKPDRTPVVWVVAEPRNRAEWMGGGEAYAMLVDRSGATIASVRSAIDPGSTSVRLLLSPASTLAAGGYDVQLRVKPPGSAPAASDSTRVIVAEAPRASGAVFLRRGPTTGNRDLPTADLRFRRGDRLSVEIPVMAASGQPAARLLDRSGKALPAIPVAAGARIDADGQTWLSAQLSLAPLGAGDYLVEVTSGFDVTLVAFRVVP